MSRETVTEAMKPWRPTPCLLPHADEQARNLQNRIADTESVQREEKQNEELLRGAADPGANGVDPPGAVHEVRQHGRESRSTVMRGKSGSSDLVARLRIANERMRRLREESESADNVIRFRVERHLEAVEETLGDLNVRAIDVPAAAGSYARRRLEQGLRRAEAEVLFAEAKLGAARAEEIHDVLGFARATVQAMSAPRGASRGREEA